MTFPRALAGAVLLATASATSAAGFDCAQAATSVERLVCADPAVSKLDERLAEAYRQASARDPHAKDTQREWLAHTRNACATTACLAQAYTARLAELSRVAPPCPVTARTLVGAWLNVDANGATFEEADFSTDHGEQAFVSFVRHAPFITGTWTLKDCRVHIAGSGDRTDFDFDVVALTGGRLHLRDEADGSVLVLRRAKAD